MDPILALLVVVVIANIVLIFLLLRRQQGNSSAAGDSHSLVLLQNQLQDLSRNLEGKLGEGTDRMFDSMSRQFDQSQRLMQNITKQVSDQLIEVTKGVTETKESTKQVFTIAEQLHNLEAVLKNQKQRGNLGEASLELILSNVLPGQYEPQYLFRDGEKVDFAVKTPEGLVPIDAKFPLENYMRLIHEGDEERQEVYRREFKSDVKKRIDETAKYIRPEEGTLPFAFMFIPAEGIYYDLLNSDVGVGVNSKDLIAYAYEQKNVIIVSPTTFLAYLKTVLFNLQRMKVQDAAKDIIKNVSELSKHLKSYEESHNSLGKSLSAAVGHYEKSGKAFRSIDKDVLKITEESMELQLDGVERPMLEGRE
ncbi:MAG TPA: DNA recombination protein RmuC [Candidatus Paceibacterota bacterium]|nr:DNA recombination protein RmuC [Candidatus Paceibacterota bacterium]